MITRVHAHISRPLLPHGSQLIVGVLLLFCLGLGYLSCVRFLRIAIVQCVQSGSPCTETDQQLADSLRGRSLMSTMDLKILGKKVLFEKKFPRTLVVNIEPLAVFTIVYRDEAHASASYLYSDRTVQVAPIDALSSPSATLAMTDLTLNSITGSVVLSDSQFGVYTELLAFAKSQAIEEILIRQRDMIEIHTTRGLIALVSTNGLTDQLRSLQLLLASPTIEQKPARVDMRFDRPVLQYL